MFDIILKIKCNQKILNNFLTNTITDTPNYHFALNAQGRYITDLYLIPLQNNQFLINISHTNTSNFIQHIKKYDIHDEIIIEITNYYTLYGQKDEKAIIYAKSVKDMASKYRKQLTICKKNLNKNKYIIF